MRMKIYCMSDIHGCLEEFKKALSMVLDRIISLQNEYCIWHLSNAVFS